MKQIYLIFALLLVGCENQVYSVQEELVQTDEKIPLRTGDVIIINGDNSHVNIIRVNGGAYIECTGECLVNLGVRENQEGE